MNTHVWMAFNRGLRLRGGLSLTDELVTLRSV